MVNILDHKGLYFSQNGEAGILNECIERMKLPVGVAVEFGAPTKEYCSNINHLRGWNLMFFDNYPAEEGIIKAFITTDNVNKIIPPCSILSIDIDGNDYNVWQAYKHQPDIVIIEINSSLAPGDDFFTPEQGCNFSMMNKLAESKGYFLLCHTGNCIYVLNKYKELFPDADRTFNTSWLC